MEYLSFFAKSDDVAVDFNSGEEHRLVRHDTFEGPKPGRTEVVTYVNAAVKIGDRWRLVRYIADNYQFMFLS